MPSRDQSLRPDTWNLLGTSGNVFENPPARIDSSSTPKRGMLHPWNLNAAFGDPVRLSTGRPVARSEERNRETIPTPRFSRRPSTMKFSSFQQKEHIHIITRLINLDTKSRSFSIDKFSHTFNVSCWKIRFKTEVSACSSFPSEAMLWIKVVEMVYSVDDLK